MVQESGGEVEGVGDGEVVGEGVAVDGFDIADCDVEGVKKDVVGVTERDSEAKEVTSGGADPREESFLFTSVWRKRNTVTHVQGKVVVMKTSFYPHILNLKICC